MRQLPTKDQKKTKFWKQAKRNSYTPTPHSEVTVLNTVKVGLS